ncbi:MAG: hypothetical protein HC836_39130 [Richelia sp. RM2_1_2]|nr:hypothetical protein [Richelia sp. RM2_1_2]
MEYWYQACIQVQDYYWGFYGTENHRVVSQGVKVEAKDAESIDFLTGASKRRLIPVDPFSVIDGLMIGDGYWHKASNKGFLCIGQNDSCYLGDESIVKDLVIRARPGVGPHAWEVKHSLTESDLCRVYDRRIPSKYMYADSDTAMSFLMGLYSANGSVVDNRITLKTSSSQLAEDVQVLLSSVGIPSYITTNKPTIFKLGNGSYECGSTYDVNITRGRDAFLAKIGFLQTYKVNKINPFVTSTKPVQVSKDIISVDYVGDLEVFDITVDNEPHTYWSGGCNVSNCVEIGMMPSIEENGKLYHTMQGCNLTEINGKLNFTVDELMEATTCASFLGTLQAGYTKFSDYLPESFARTFEKEALIGVSITGWFNNPKLLTDVEVQKILAENVQHTNKIVAEKLGINPAARTTCVKPSGNASVVLQTSSGVTPEHAPRYFRGVQVNKLHAIGDIYKALNPKAVEESVWSSTGSDYYVVFPVEVEGAIYKDDVSAIEHLEYIKLIQQNWIEFGTNFDHTRHEKLRHNVSNTVTVQEGEWDSVIDYIFENKQFFTGLSLLGGSGDRDYQQAPFTKVLNEIELVEEYGSAAIFASGLIVDALHVFNDLWEAIRYVDSIDNIKESLYGMIESEVSDEDRTKMFAKFDWIKRFNKFASNYFNGDTYKTGLCLKDCHNFHRWVAITRNYKQVSWSTVLPRPNYTAVDTLAATACHGDSCVINLG